MLCEVVGPICTVWEEGGAVKGCGGGAKGGVEFWVEGTGFGGLGGSGCGEGGEEGEGEEEEVCEDCHCGEMGWVCREGL